MSDFHKLTLNDLLLGLRDLFSNRAEPMSAVVASQIYGPLLRKALEAIEALPGALDAAPLREALGRADARHDGYGEAIWWLTEAYLSLPELSDEARDAIDRIRRHLVPERRALQSSYAVEAAATSRKRATLDSLTADLERFPTVDGTLAAWAEAHVGAGEEIGALLEQRAVARQPDASASPALRGSTVRTLNSYRQAVADERRARQDLPSDLDARLFTYFDELAND